MLPLLTGQKVGKVGKDLHIFIKEASRLQITLKKKSPDIMIYTLQA